MFIILSDIIVELKKQKLFNKRTDDYDISFEEVVQGGGACYHLSSVLYKQEFIFNKPYFFKVAHGMGDYPLSIYLTLSGKVHYFGDVMSVYRYGVDGSWTERVRTDTSKTINHLREEIKMLLEVDKYSDGSYHEIIAQIIVKREYKILELEGKFDELKKGKYREIYKKRSKKHKIKIWFEKHANWIYVLYKRKKHIYE